MSHFHVWSLPHFMEYFLIKLGLGEKRTIDHKLMASPTSGNCCDSLHWIWRTNIVIKLSFTNTYVNIYWTKFVSDLLCAAARMRTRMMGNIWEMVVLHITMVDWTCGRNFSALDISWLVSLELMDSGSQWIRFSERLQLRGGSVAHWHTLWVKTHLWRK